VRNFLPLQFLQPSKRKLSTFRTSNLNVKSKSSKKNALNGTIEQWEKWQTEHDIKAKEVPQT
jgi:hypothetical protein